MAKNSIRPLESTLLKGEGVSPIKTKEVTNFIKTKEYGKPTTGINESAERINTINSSLEGKVHPGTDIPFQKKDVITGDGKIVTGVFPNFNSVSVYNTTLPKDLIKAPTKVDIVKQNIYCRDSFRPEFLKNRDKYENIFKEANKQLIKDGTNKLHGKELNMKQILEKQTNDILNPTGAEAGNIYGFSWHHHENMGKMQLVPEGIHKKVKHTGGHIIWSK